MNSSSLIVMTDAHVCELLLGQRAAGVRKASWKHTPRGASFQLAIDPL